MKTQIDVPAKYRKLISRAKEGTVSPRQAIKAKCIECCGFDIKTAQDCRVPEIKVALWGVTEADGV